APKITAAEQRALDVVAEALGGRVSNTDFWSIEVATGSVICEADEAIGQIGSPNFPAALAALRKALIHYFTLHKWEDMPSPGRSTGRNIFDERDPVIDAALATAEGESVHLVSELRRLRTPAGIAEALRGLGSDEERKQAIHHICNHCGCVEDRTIRGCQCWNDE
ncbi:MAG: hypothetical protein Q8S13_03860, partial [Dehalococcoidia bacterium]|nr:hypothetical protein [Dehalococcoidia bacterium]